ncbi:MAG: hypothetical protein R3E14_01685 [Erythrobacter sp.]
MTTVGNERDYRYFLPRIFQLAFEDPTYLGVEPPLLAWRIKRAGFDEFSPQQTEAVAGAFLTGFYSAVTKHPDDNSCFPDWWSAIGLLGAGFRQTFEIFEEIDDINPALQVAELLLSEAIHIQKHGPISAPFGQEHADETALIDITGFLFSDKCRAHLSAMRQFASAEDADRFLGPAIDVQDQFTPVPHR